MTSWLRRHLDFVIATGLALVTFLALFFHGQEMGSTRDEGFYFDAAESYAGWFKELARDPLRALEEPVIRRYYEINREHPVLFKNLMALSYLAFGPSSGGSVRQSEPGAFTRAMRIPGQLNAALLLALIYLLGASLASRRVGLFAAAAFLLAPRHFFHMHLACFDMPITTCWLATVIAYRKAQRSFAWGILTGVFFGLALSVKHNAFFIPAVLVLHWLVVERKSFSFSRQSVGLPRIPLPFLSMLILGPVLFFLLWPFIWHQTFERIGWFLGFHLHHVNYYWEYLGTLLTEPPFPWLYPFTVTALTLPAPTLLLCTIGFLGALGERLGHPLRLVCGFLGRLSGLRAAERETACAPWANAFDGWLLLLNGFLPIFIIAIPSVPIFGGVKHWLPAMPFLCVLAGIALERMLTVLPENLGRLRLTRNRVFAAAGALALLPSLLGTVQIDNYGTAFYNELAGGIRGGADLGMQRQYWSNNVSGVLPWINEHLPQNARLFLHEVTGESFRTYQRDGYLRPDLRMAWSPDGADFVAYQYHREFVDAEYRVWNKTGKRKPVYGLWIDEVPLILVYDAR